MDRQWHELQDRMLTRRRRSVLFGRTITSLALGGFTLGAVLVYILLRT